MIDLSRLWNDFWKTIDTIKPIQNIEGIIYKDKSDTWKMIVLSPHDDNPLVVQVDFNPWTGDKLE